MQYENEYYINMNNKLAIRVKTIFFLSKWNNSDNV